MDENTFDELAQRMDACWFDIEHDPSSCPLSIAGASGSQAPLPLLDDPQKPNDVIMQIILYDFCVVLLVYVWLCLYLS